MGLQQTLLEDGSEFWTLHVNILKKINSPLKDYRSMLQSQIWICMLGKKLDIDSGLLQEGAWLLLLLKMLSDVGLLKKLQKP